MIFELVSSAVNMKDTWRVGVLCTTETTYVSIIISFPDVKHGLDITPVQKKKQT